MSGVYDLGLRLRELRRRNKLTQSQVAKRLGVRRATISGYENNTALPSISKMVELALLYRTSTDYILGLDNRPTIVLEGMTPRECEAILTIMELFMAELKAHRLS